MPSVSQKQHRLMEAVAHNAGFARRVGVPQTVGKDFAAADQGKSVSSLPETAGKKKSKKAPGYFGAPQG